MKLERFFEKFDQFADAPNAVAKMRELVLHLTVQGRLVANCSENPLGIAEITALKERALRELRLRSHPESPLLTEDDFPFTLPSSWHGVSLCDLAFSCPTSYGEDPSPSLVKAGVVKVGNIDNLGGFKGRFSERGFPADEIESLFARSGDLMVVKSSGSAENVHSGKTALCTVEHDGKIVGSNFVLRLRLFGASALPEYIWRVLTSRYSRAWVEKTVQTMTYPNLKWTDFAKLPIPLPPLAEQKRIVAKVDELMVLCDRLEAQQQERDTRHAALARASLARFAEAPTPANLDFLFDNSYTITPADLRKSILALAVQGKLVPQDPNDEPADALYSRIQSTKERLIKERTIKRVSVEPNPKDDAGDLLPTGWMWTHMGNAFDVRDGTHDTPKYTTAGFPLITSKNIYSGILSFEGANFISEKDHRQISERSRVDRGDILFAMIGSIGNPVIVDTDREFSIKNVALFKYYSLADAEPRFLLLYLRLVSEEMREKAAGGVQSFVSLSFLRNYPFPLPPLAEQRRIVARVDQLMALVDQLETQLTASRATAAKLMEAVVAELTASAPSSPINSTVTHQTEPEKRAHAH